MQMFAYLDPGSGSILIQVAIAAVLGAGFYFRRFVISPLQGVWQFLTRRNPRSEEGQA